MALNMPNGQKTRATCVNVETVSGTNMNPQDLSRLNRLVVSGTAYSEEVMIQV
mgnify:CR=1 FL=1